MVWWLLGAISVLVLAVIVIVVFRTNREAAPIGIEKLLGFSRAEISRQLGQPDRSGKDFDSFFKIGLAVNYNHAEKATEILATQFASGDAFSENILGIRLRDSKEDCIASWGEPIQTKETGFEYETITWHHKEYALVLEVWVRDGSDKGFGTYQKGMVKRISLTKKSKAV